MCASCCVESFSIARISRKYTARIGVDAICFLLAVPSKRSTSFLISLFRIEHELYIGVPRRFHVAIYEAGFRANNARLSVSRASFIHYKSHRACARQFVRWRVARRLQACVAYISNNIARAMFMIYLATLPRPRVFTF